MNMKHRAGHQLQLLAYIKCAAFLINLEVIGNSQVVISGGSGLVYTRHTY